MGPNMYQHCLLFVTFNRRRYHVIIIRTLNPINATCFEKTFSESLQTYSSVVVLLMVCADFTERHVRVSAYISKL